MRGLYVLFQVLFHCEKFASDCGSVGAVWFAVVFSGRGSQVERCTRAAHSASEGNAEPGGRIAKYPPAGGLAIRAPGRGRDRMGAGSFTTTALVVVVTCGGAVGAVVVATCLR